jgi:O-antigen/teichoic acid export membrane protein
LFSAFFSLASTRIVLRKLGADDYGLFSVIAGFTAMLGFLSSAMTTATQRSFAHALGRNDIQLARKNYSIAIILHFLLIVLVVIVAESAGFYLFRELLKIPVGREKAAIWLYQLTLVGVLATVMGVPFQALFSATEKMSFVAILAIMQNMLVFVLALLLYFVDLDSLMLYGIGSTVILLLITFVSFFICKRTYPEICVLDHAVIKDFSAIREMASYCGWNVFGALASITRNQGIAVLLNSFFGTMVNASYAVSNQMSSQIAFISQSLFRSITPQIVKAEGGNDRLKMISLTNAACKYSFFLLSLTAVPIIAETPYILELWLKNVPNEAMLFVMLLSISALIEQLTAGIMVAMQAVGRIALYQVVVGSILLSNLFIGFILLKAGFGPSSVLVAMVVLQLIAGIARLAFFRRACSGKIKEWFTVVLFPSAAWLLPSCFLAFSIPQIIKTPSFFRLCITTGLFVLTSSLIFYFVVLRSEEKRRVKELLIKVLGKKSLG